MPTVEHLSELLLGRGTAVLMVDACAVLDAVRGPARGNLAATAGAAAVLADVTSGAPSLVFSSVTRREIGDHLDGAEIELHGYLAKHERDAVTVNDLCPLLGVPTMALGVAAWSTTLPALTAKIATELVTAGLHIDHDDARSKRAGDRVLQKRAPAATKGEFKDAILVEEMVELAGKLRRGGFATPIVLLTSNFKDFCAPRSKALHPELAAEFTPLGVALSLNWAHARHLSRRS